MNYVICVQNQSLAIDEPADTYGNELIVGQVYKVVLPEPNDGPHRLRVIDGSGEDYLYPANYFVPLFASDRFDTNGHAKEQASESVTVHLPPHVKGILHAEAVAAHKSVSGLLREWIEERIDLPEFA